MKGFRDLKVWEKSHELTLEVYKLSKELPASEIYGLTNQVRRASSSIAANIAEGCGRNSDADFARFLHIAMGSASELEYHLLLAKDLGMLSQSSYANVEEKVTEVKRMLSSLILKLEADR